MRRGAGLDDDAVLGRKRLRFMGVEVLLDWWVSLRMRPLKEAIVAFVVKAILGRFAGDEKIY